MTGACRRHKAISQGTNWFWARCECLGSCKCFKHSPVMFTLFRTKAWVLDPKHALRPARQPEAQEPLAFVVWLRTPMNRSRQAAARGSKSSGGGKGGEGITGAKLDVEANAVGM
jgi:hypothetical protein